MTTDSQEKGQNPNRHDGENMGGETEKEGKIQSISSPDNHLIMSENR
jgi:hypothetical protein